MSSVRFYGLVLAFAALLMFLQYRLWFETGGIRDIWQLKQQIAAQTAQNEKLKMKNDELLMQIQHLQKSEEAIEARARNELGMVKKGETFYQIVNPGKDDA